MSTFNLITGGAGFIGSNLAARLLEAGEPVVLLDDLSRSGVAHNVDWLKQRFGSSCKLLVGDVRNLALIEELVPRASAVFHFAAQVAVTASLVRPFQDFDINACGTLNVLEALRACSRPPPLFFTSTNKVYGALADLELRGTAQGYRPCDDATAALGVGEGRPLDFHSPYGCSKGAADQYVRDYARSFGLRTVVFRMSCIYGPRQFGTEDQGWVAHLMLRALRGESVTVYGDGNQVRDLLFVSDLVDAFLRARQDIASCAGEVFNIGGGPENALSVLQVLKRIEPLAQEHTPVTFEPARTGDQRYYVSDTRKFQRMTGWQPRVGVDDGLPRLRDWLASIARRPPSAARAELPRVATR